MILWNWINLAIWSQEILKSKLYILNSIEEFQDCKKDIRNGDKIIYTSELLGLQLKEDWL